MGRCVSRTPTDTQHTRHEEVQDHQEDENKQHGRFGRAYDTPGLTPARVCMGKWRRCPTRAPVAGRTRGTTNSRRLVRRPLARATTALGRHVLASLLPHPHTPELHEELRAVVDTVDIPLLRALRRVIEPNRRRRSSPVRSRPTACGDSTHGDSTHGDSTHGDSTHGDATLQKEILLPHLRLGVVRVLHAGLRQIGHCRLCFKDSSMHSL